MEVEYFFKKAGQVFDHFPSRRIFIYPDTLKKKYSLKSSDDSIEVITKRDFLQIKKRKFSDVKVYRSSVSSFTEIEILRNQYSLLVFSRGLFEELKRSKDFDSLAFRNKLSSYELENKLSTGEKEFNSLLNEVGKNIKEEFRKE